MFSAFSLTVFLTLALVVVATPLVNVRDTPVTIPFAKRINFTGPVSLYERDLARVRHLRARAGTTNASRSLVEDSATGSVSAMNQAVDYVADVSGGYIAAHDGANNYYSRLVLVALQLHVRILRPSECSLF